MRGLSAIEGGIAGGCLAILGGLSTMALEGKSFSLEVLWSTEIVGAPPPGPPGTTGTLQFGTGLIVSAQSMFADGRIVWLGNQIGPRKFPNPARGRRARSTG